MNKPIDLPTVAPARSPAELALIYAAERLFAEHGIAAVSLRQINQAARQKNISAAHYHFGSRDGLVLAVLEHRWLDLDRRRQVRLDAAGENRDMRFYVNLLIETLAQELDPRPEGNHYIRFLWQYESYRSGQELARSMSPAGVEVYERIGAAIAHLPEPIRAVRMRYLVNIIHGVLAAAEHQLETGQLVFSDVPLLVSNLVDMVTAAMSASPSDETCTLI